MERIEKKLINARDNGDYVGIILKNKSMTVQNMVIIDKVICDGCLLSLETHGRKNETDITIKKDSIKEVGTLTETNFELELFGGEKIIFEF